MITRLRIVAGRRYLAEEKLRPREGWYFVQGLSGQEHCCSQILSLKLPSVCVCRHGFERDHSSVFPVVLFPLTVLGSLEICSAKSVHGYAGLNQRCVRVAVGLQTHPQK